MSSVIVIKSVVTIGLVAGFAVNLFAQKANADQLRTLKASMNQYQISFTENKGQVYDQNHSKRPDVLFGGQSNGLVFHLKNNGISYQLNKIDKWKPENSTSGNKKDSKQKRIERNTAYRVDINWLNVNTRVEVLTAKELEGYEIFYSNDKQLFVKSFAEVTYKNIYKGIDLKWYEKDGELKYDYLCAAGSDYKKIKLQIEGAQNLSLNAHGELEITTPLGTIIEKAPLVLQQGKLLVSKWLLTDNVLSFNIENLNPQLDYIIDPAVRAWGTYYGGNSFDYANACATYTNGDVYMVGSTYLNTSTIIATSGAHQSTMGGFDDAYLVKFNSSGVRQWSTYYGGSDSDNGRSVVVDALGNVYICGITSSTNGIATAGAHQASIGGGNLSDGFLVKFNSAGVRQWATYYGGNSSDEFHQCTLDPSGNVYASGSTDLTTSTVIATSGTHQNSFGGGPRDGFLVKFNTSGVRQWGTYYGGTDVDFGNSCAADANNVYLAGITSSTNAAMVSSGCHQSAFGGSLNDAYLVKFNNSNGTRLWATFYGGNAIDLAYGCAVDASGNVYMCGVSTTSVANVIATSVSHQSVGATVGDDEAYLVKFNSLGTRVWGTYYGGDGYDVAYGCAVNASSDVYLFGTTSSTLGSAIATAGSYQTVFGTTTGGVNAFLAKFNTGGTRQWGTYYGVDGEDGNGCSTLANGDVYLCGPTTATLSSAISTSGSHQPNLGGIFDGYLVKFTDCNSQAPTNVTTATNQVICAGSNATLSATSGTSAISWFATATSTQVIGTGTNYVTSNLMAGTYSFYAQGSSICGTPPRAQITITVNTTPTITASGGTICSGQSFTLQPNGASTYTVFEFFSGNPLPGMVVSPITTSVYVVVGTNTNGCISALANMQSVTITVNASPTISVNNGTICAGQSFVIQPSGANTYTIQGGTATVSPVTATNYTVTGTSANGCAAANAATCTVTIDAIPTVAVNNASVCALSVYTIQPSGANSYTIQGGSFTVSPSSNSSYTIIGASAAGCLSQNVATCNISIAPSPTISASSGTICSGQSFTITPSGAATYSILNNNTGIPYTSNMVVAPLTSTNYAIAGTGSNGCISNLGGLALINVTVINATISANSGTICSGGSFTLVPSDVATYTFQGNNFITPATSGIYTVPITYNAGCKGVATATVVVETSPTITVSGVKICPGWLHRIEPKGASTYTIQGGQALVNPTITTSYTITGTSAAGCPAVNIATCRVEIDQSRPTSPFPSTITAPYYLNTRYRKGKDIIATIKPTSSSTYLEYDYDDNVALRADGFDKNPAIYTLTILNPGVSNCVANFTLLVNPPSREQDEQLIANWVFPNFLSPNNDGLNDDWMPSYKGANYKNTQNSFENSIYLSEGMNLIKNIRIVNYINPELEYYKWIKNEPVNLFTVNQVPIFWNTVAEQIKETTFCTLIVNFENGSKKTFLMGVNHKSKQ